MFRPKKSISTKFLLPILMLIFLFSISGCANKSGSPANTSTPPSAQNGTSATTPGATSGAASNIKPVPKPGAVTYENYLNIKFDTTYDDIKNILGDGVKDELSTDVIDYKWNDQGKTITIRTLKGKVESKSQSKLGKTTSNLTEDQFKKITSGMTFDQVTSILGTDYQEVSTSKSDKGVDRLVAWMMPDSKSIKVKFQDDKVIKAYNYLKK